MKEIYQQTEIFPKAEIFGITNQIRRASTSISANIAEGFGRGSDIDIARFVQIAIGSASEVECFLILAADLELLKIEKSNELQFQIIEIRKMLISLLKKLKEKN